MKHTFLFFCGLLASAAHQAQTLPALMIEQDAASLALAGATVAAPAGPASIRSNVGGMAFHEGLLAAGANFALWQPAAAGEKLAGASALVRLGKLALGADVRMMFYPSYNLVNDNGVGGRSTDRFTPSESAYAVGVAYRIIDPLSVGVTLRYAASTLSKTAKASSFGGDIGVKFQAGPLHAGLSVNNLGTPLKYSDKGTSWPSPALARAGAAFELAGFLVSAEADYLFAGAFNASLGAEYGWKKMLFVRAGYHYGSDRIGVPSFASVGLGGRFLGVRIDAAYLFASPVLGNSFSVSLGFAL